jgi:hypothetical protein
MITARLRGQTGNQMFIVAAAVAHALKNNTDFAFPSTSGKRNQFIFMFQSKFPSVDSLYLREMLVYQEQKFGEYNPIPDGHHMCIQGYFQSERYFKEYKDQILPMFKIPRYDFVEPGTVSIHVRRKDYITQWQNKYPQPTDKYWDEAIAHFPESRFLVFSDDIEWCRNKWKGDRFIFTNEPRGEISDLGLMASCDHHIIMNSTFGWWGAYLGHNPDKTVIAPHKDNWFTDKYKEVLSSEDIIPKEWKQIKY